MRLLSRVSLAAVAVCVSASLTGGIATAETNAEPLATTNAASSAPATFTMNYLDDDSLFVEIENSEFITSGDGGVDIVNSSGVVLEYLSSELADFEIVSPTSLSAVAPRSAESLSANRSLKAKGFCPLGTHKGGGCRGGGVAKGAGKGAIMGGVGGCVAGAVLTAGPGCGPGAAAGAITGGVGGAIGGAFGW